MPKYCASSRAAVRSRGAWQNTGSCTPILGIHRRQVYWILPQGTLLRYMVNFVLNGNPANAGPATMNEYRIRYNRTSRP